MRCHIVWCAMPCIFFKSCIMQRACVMRVASCIMLMGDSQAIGFRV